MLDQAIEDVTNRYRDELELLKGALAAGILIIGSLKTLILDWEIPPASIKLYVGTPTCFGIMTAQAMLLNPYPYMREALSSPCFIVKKPGYFFEHFRASHFTAWSSIMALPVPDDLDGIEASLHSYAEHIGRLMELAMAPNGPTPPTPKNVGSPKSSQTSVH